MTQTDGLLFNPNTYDPEQFDDETRRLLRATIDWFEGQGKKRILDDDLAAQWPADFVDFVKREKLFATFLTPSEFSHGDPNKRWDAARNAALSEILGFYGLTYWYTEQVTILGLGPIWQSENKDAKLKAADDLDAGGVMAFGLSERDHGADVYHTDMVLTPANDDDRANGVVYRATGEKYYIGNGNVASMVSVFGRRGDIQGQDAYIFFAVDSQHENYHLIDNVVHMQIYVSTFRLEDYPVREEDILHTGVEAFAAALNTVNVGKFNLCTCTIGMTEHAFYEAITHAQNHILYGNPVTDFSHVRVNFVDAYCRLVAMKLFSQRAVDYFRSASLEDRRYLLFNPMTKAKVTMEGETVLRALHDVIAAKGYEKNTMFREVSQLIGTLPRLEGTVHVNVGLMLKFMPNYMLNPKEYPPIPIRNDAADDTFFWNQGPTRGAGKVQFADWAPVYEEHAGIPN
ncbi:MAG TPA: acyl-CoA dehydrogenase family protein, partial [Mycobacterium sp.]|nr:acyl-CoA dehydrogenase family protein [Mycobacterium sp.]